MVNLERVESYIDDNIKVSRISGKFLADDTITEVLVDVATLHNTITYNPVTRKILERMELNKVYDIYLNDGIISHSLRPSVTDGVVVTDIDTITDTAITGSVNNIYEMVTSNIIFKHHGLLVEYNIYSGEDLTDIMSDVALFVRKSK